MTQRDKLIAKIKLRPPQADFSDVERLLKDFGWTLDRQRGSHAIFTKVGERAMTVPKVGGQKVKRIYLDMICERLGLED